MFVTRSITSYAYAVTTPLAFVTAASSPFHGQWPNASVPAGETERMRRPALS